MCGFWAVFVIFYQNLTIIARDIHLKKTNLPKVGFIINIEKVDFLFSIALTLHYICEWFNFVDDEAG